MSRRRRRIRLGGGAVGAVAALLAVPGAASATVSSNVAGGVLTASSDGGDAITITCAAGNVKVNGADPGAAVACSTITSIVVNGGDGANAIHLNGVVDDPGNFENIASVTVYGGGGGDLIEGSEIADTLEGQAGNDRIVGFRNAAGTRDLMNGGEGEDTLVWNGGDGSDTMNGEAGSDTIEVNGGAGAEEFTVKPSTTAGRVSFDRVTPAPFNLDIGTAERLDLNAGGGDDSLNKDGGAAGLAPFVIDADGGDGTDLLNGGDAPDVLTGGPGNDRLVAFRNPAGTRDLMNGGEGEDTLVWNGGDGSDTMNGEAGSDTIEVNGGAGAEEFTVKPSTTAGRVSFDRVAPAPFNLDIGTAERLQLNAGGGDDEITGRKGLAALIASTFNGQDGNDRIKGSDGEDVLSGGSGRDLIRSRDRAVDEVECDGGFDLAFVDRRDRVRGCEIVLGGRLRVRHRARSVKVAGGSTRLTLQCVATHRCKGTARLLRGGKSLGKQRFSMKRKRSTTIRIELNRRGLRLLGRAPAKGLSVKLRVDARDHAGNGWRTSDGLRLRR